MDTLLTSICLPLIAAVVVPLVVYRLYLREVVRGAVRSYGLEGMVLLVMPNGDLVLKPRSLANALGLLLFSVSAAGCALAALNALLNGGSGMMGIAAFLIAIAGVLCIAWFAAWRTLRQGRVVFNRTAQQIEIRPSRGVEAGSIPFAELRAVVLERLAIEANATGAPLVRWNVGVQTDTEALALGGLWNRDADARKGVESIAQEMAAVVGNLPIVDITPAQRSP
ncbi:MAG: hypothetical protein U0670_07555 [Anaerolineae bacterium]